MISNYRALGLQKILLCFFCCKIFENPYLYLYRTLYFTVLFCFVLFFLPEEPHCRELFVVSKQQSTRFGMTCHTNFICIPPFTQEITTQSAFMKILSALLLLQQPLFTTYGCNKPLITSPLQCNFMAQGLPETSCVIL